MNKIVWINGSPKAGEESCSHQMITYFSKAVEKNYDCMMTAHALKLCNSPSNLSSHFTEVLSSQVLVFVSPLYADSMPSGMLDYLYQFEVFTKNHSELCTHPLKVYGYINCGFLGGQQNHVALKILEHFSNHMNFIWCGGLGIGSGPMLAATLNSVPKEAKMQRPIYEGLDPFIEALKSQTAIQTPNKQLLVTQNFSPTLFNLSQNIGWLAQSGWKFRKIYTKPYSKK